MYEVEVRALVDFDSMKRKLDKSAKPLKLNEREATIFFFNPEKEDFELRLRFRKNNYILSYKESLSKTARKEIETEISNPDALYHLLLGAGFKIKMIVARVKFTYLYNKFEILLNRIADWGDAIEVESVIEDEGDAGKTESEIREFMKTKLGISNLLGNEKLKSLNEDYRRKIDFYDIPLETLLEYVNGKRNYLKFT